MGGLDPLESRLGVGGRVVEVTEAKAMSSDQASSDQASSFKRLDAAQQNVAAARTHSNSTNRMVGDGRGRLRGS